MPVNTAQFFVVLAVPGRIVEMVNACHKCFRFLCTETALSDLFAHIASCPPTNVHLEG